MNENSKRKIEVITLGAALTALVVVLQLIGASIRFGTFSVSLVLIPIVIGAATCGKYIGAWLGFVFGMAVLLSGDAALFMGISDYGTIITVLLKGTACGFIAGLVYELLAKKSKTLGAVVSAIVCPIVNTGIFVLGCFVFFKDFIASGAGNQNLFIYTITVFVGLNFVFELLVNLVLCPAVVRIIQVIRKM